MKRERSRAINDSSFAGGGAVRSDARSAFLNASVSLKSGIGITVERARELEQHVTDVAATEGLEFRFDVARSGTTFDAHRIVHLAENQGLLDQMKERLLRAYFAEAELISDHRTLARLAAEVGIPEDETRATLAGERYAEQVNDDERTAGRLGISAVPTFVIDRALDASGAHPADALLDLLRQGWASRTPVLVAGAAESCARRRLLAATGEPRRLGVVSALSASASPSELS